jgi:hypothetical protein
LAALFIVEYGIPKNQREVYINIKRFFITVLFQTSFNIV